MKTVRINAKLPEELHTELKVVLAGQKRKIQTWVFDCAETEVVASKMNKPPKKK